MRINRYFSIFFIFMIAGCASHTVREPVAVTPWPPPNSATQGFIEVPRGEEINRILYWNATSNVDAIYTRLRGYLSANSEAFVGDLMHEHRGLSLRFASVAIMNNDASLFYKVLEIASSSEQDSRSLDMLRSMQIAWDRCGYRTVEAMRLYIRSQRNLNALKPYIRVCPSLKAVF